MDSFSSSSGGNVLPRPNWRQSDFCLHLIAGRARAEGSNRINVAYGRGGRDGGSPVVMQWMDKAENHACLHLYFLTSYINCTWHMHDFPMNVQPSNRGGMPSVRSDGCLRSSSSSNNSSNSIPRRLSTECTATCGR